MNKLYACILVFSVNVLNASVLYSQIPDTLDAIGYRCQRDTVYMDDIEIVDDIVPTNGGWRIDSVVAWFGNWSGFVTWGVVPDIHFIVYQDSSGQPVDSPLIEIVVDQSNYTAYIIDSLIPPYPTRWRVELSLPFPVNLDTLRYWVEVQPSCHDFGAHGKTGHQAEVGIGNGQDFYMRDPGVGWLTWETATALFGQPLETGFMLIGVEMGIAEKPTSTPVHHYDLNPTIVNGPLLMPTGEDCKIFDIMGRRVEPDKVKPGIYFIEIDGQITQKVIKVR
jgi:hypothetical protein